jgi:hypothetical protein
MAGNDDPWKRFRDKQEGGKKDLSLTRQRAVSSGAIEQDAKQLTTADLENICADCEQQMDQLAALYNQFMANAEKRPPLEQRKRLGRQVDILVQAPKAGSQIRFKCNNTVMRFQTLCDRWDKQTRALENGAMKRRNQK